VKVNDYLTENIPKGMFITVLMGIYDGRDHGLKLVSAGHNPLILFRGSTRHTSRFNPAGMPLGVPMSTESQFADAVEELQLQLEDGDAFIFYSDGITEAINREGQQYGVERLESFLHERWSSNSAPSVSSLAGSLVEEIDSFSGYAQQRDDITFVLGRTRFSAMNSEAETAVQAESIEQQTIDRGPQQQA
jgi:sigma-B regulation protein RsbU (phosphoserine phosphatase)